MIFRGTMLWRECKSLFPTARDSECTRSKCAQIPSANSQLTNPTWVEGGWEITNGCIHRLSDSDRRPAAIGGWALPGLVDVHAHIGFGPQGPVGKDIQEKQARQECAAGVLLIRDCGSLYDNSWIHDRDDLPRLIRAGTHLARTKRYIRGHSRELSSPPDLVKAAVQEARSSDGWVKIVADWIDRSNGVESDLQPLWPRDVLCDAVSAIHNEGARVTVHSFSHASIDDLLEAGVDGIEHATGLDDDQLSEVVKQKILITPTLMQVDLFSTFADQAGRKYPAYASTMLNMYEHRHEHAAKIFESGARIMPGSDAGGYQKHGSIARELVKWAELGVNANAIIASATWKTRDVLGVSSLYEGAPADFIVLDRDPRCNIEALSKPSHVILRGKRMNTVM